MKRFFAPLLALAGLLIAAEASASYPAQVCPILAVDEPGLVCREVQSTVWQFNDGGVYPNITTYVQSDDLESAKVALLDFVRSRFNCADCHFIAEEEYNQVAAFNKNLIHPNPNLPAPAFVPVLYSSHPDHSYESSWLSFGTREDHQVIIGRVETAASGLGWYNQNPNAKIFFIPNTLSLKWQITIGHSSPTLSSLGGAPQERISRPTILPLKDNAFITAHPSLIRARLMVQAPSTP